MGCIVQNSLFIILTIQIQKPVLKKNLQEKKKQKTFEAYCPYSIFFIPLYWLGLKQANYFFSPIETSKKIPSPDIFSVFSA